MDPGHKNYFQLYIFFKQFVSCLNLLFIFHDIVPWVGSLVGLELGNTLQLGEYCQRPEEHGSSTENSESTKSDFTHAITLL